MSNKVTIKVKDQNDWEKENGVVTLMVTGRVSFPNIWKPGIYDGAELNHLSCNIMLDGATDSQITELKKIFLNVARHKVPRAKFNHIQDIKLDKDSDGKYSIKTRAGKNSQQFLPVFYTTKTRAPVEAVLEQDGSVTPPIDPETGKSATETLYAGCWALFRITLSSDIKTIAGKDKKKVKYPKVWVNLVAIRKVGDDVKFGGDRLSSMGDDMGESFGDDMSTDDDLGDDGLGDDLDDDLDGDLDDDLDGDLDDDLDDDIPY